MTTSYRFKVPSESDFPRSSKEEVFACDRRIRKKREKREKLEKWEEYLCSRFDEWRAISGKRYTVVKSEDGRVTFVPGDNTLRESVPRFTFEQILQAAIPLRPHFESGYDAAKAAEDLLTACHQRSIVNLKKRIRSESAEQHHATVSFEDGIKSITGNKRADRAQKIFKDLLQLEQTEALFSGIFFSPGGFYDPKYPEREDELFVDSFPDVTPPGIEFKRHEHGGFTRAEVERFTLARNFYIKQGRLSGELVAVSFEEKISTNQKNTCIRNSDKNHPSADRLVFKTDNPSERSDKTAVSKRQPKPKR